MKPCIWGILAGLILGVSAGCDRNPKSLKGFVLPEGDSARGQAAFASLQCTACHRVDGVPGLKEPSVPATLVVLIGGDVTKLRSYGDLLTAVIHPSYELSDRLPAAFSRRVPLSPMPAVNDKLSVAQMVDLVTFLQPRYRKIVPLYQPYTAGIP